MKTKEEIMQYKKEWHQKNKEKIRNKKNEYQKEWRKTQVGRATSLLSAYRQADKREGRGECTLTAQWIVDNIFTHSCAHCEESDWHNIGCNRINNDLPHTPDNVEPCCLKCNLILEDNKRDSSGRFINRNGE